MTVEVRRKRKRKKNMRRVSAMRAREKTAGSVGVIGSPWVRDEQGRKVPYRKGEGIYKVRYPRAMSHTLWKAWRLGTLMPIPRVVE